MLLSLMVRSRFAPFILPPPLIAPGQNVHSENNVIDAIHQLEEMDDLERSSEVTIIQVCTMELITSCLIGGLCSCGPTVVHPGH